jgi:hypothetical protein
MHRQRPITTHCGHSDNAAKIHEVARSLAFSCVALWAMTLTAAAGAASPRTVFSTYDPDGRLPNTDIRELGAVHVQDATFSIYYLSFVNPVSRHGQHRIAIIRNGDQFAGAFQCWLGEGGAKLVIGKDRLTVYEGGLTFVIRFDRNGPADRKSYLCGEGSGWQNSV